MDKELLSVAICSTVGSLYYASVLFMRLCNFFFFTNALLKLAGGRGTGCGQPGISSIALVQ